MLSFFRNALGLNKRKPAKVEPLRHRWRNRVRPGLEELENRLVPALHFIVDTLQDTPDANPGNGVAADANGNTSLRAAIMETNEHLASEGTIDFKAGLTGTITLGSALEALNKDFTIADRGLRT